MTSSEGLPTNMDSSECPPAVATGESSSCPDIANKLSFDDICFRIMPTMGSISYGYFSIHVMNAAWFRSVFHRSDYLAANTFWFNAHVGIGLYMFGSHHLRMASVRRRIMYSVFGASLFNFGSVLFWGACKTLLPDKAVLRTLFGLLSSAVLLYTGKEYVDYVDMKMKAAAT